MLLGEEEGGGDRDVALAALQPLVEQGWNVHEAFEDTVRRLFIAMQRKPLYSPASPMYEPRNNKLYDYAGIARSYSMQAGDYLEPGTKRERLDTGYTLMVDLDTLPRVTFDARGRAIGAAKEGIPTLLEEYESAERQLEVWANHCKALRSRMGHTS